MKTAETQVSRYSISCPTLPLAVYREVAAHLQQVAGVTTGLLTQRSPHFNYSQSQVGGLWLEFSPAADLQARQRVDQILKYYGDRFGNWQELQEFH
ncbi:MAG: hypothetical protein HC881_07950 [Leptolyngbyaceae cyanobacterium SL_7_1]|nr:hypothetical protein [Leptolyngbyaceae cyanobacterium SL_7_1]